MAQFRVHTKTLYNDPHYGADLRAGYYHAHRMGMCPADCEDCAMEFLLTRLLRSRENDPVDSAWRHRCASNFVKNTLRARARRETAAEYTEEVVEATPCPAPGPEEEVLRNSFWEDIHTYAAKLRPVPRQMFLRHYELEESVQDLASEFAENPHAVEQKLHRTRRRFKELLKRQGVDASNIGPYFK